MGEVGQGVRDHGHHTSSAQSAVACDKAYDYKDVRGGWSRRRNGGEEKMPAEICGEKDGVCTMDDVILE